VKTETARLQRCRNDDNRMNLRLKLSVLVLSNVVDQTLSKCGLENVHVKSDVLGDRPSLLDTLFAKMITVGLTHPQLVFRV
jgi:hypothetical protein